MIRHISYNEIECDKCGRIVKPIYEGMPELKLWKWVETGSPKKGYIEEHHCPNCQ